MKNVIIYTRVSTDEQADKECSLHHQETLLRAYSEAKKLNIIKHYQEDYSAKNFNRPEWIKLAEFAKINKRTVDMLIFTRWDRFSRNIEESYRVIREFIAMGIEVVSVENPLDLSNPE